jgi:hypothetical protein
MEPIVADEPDYTRSPPPRRVEGAVSAHDLVIADIRRVFPAGAVQHAMVAGMADRRDYGLRKYQVVLHPDNGRDPVRDVLDEVEDEAAYWRNAFSADPKLAEVFGDDYWRCLRTLCRLRSHLIGTVIPEWR